MFPRHSAFASSAIILIPIFLIPILLVPIAGGQAASSSHVEGIRFWSFGDVTRIAIETEGDYKLSTEQIENPARVYFDLSGLRPPSASHHGMQSIAVGDRRIKQIRVAEVLPGKTRIVFDLEGPVEVVSSQLVNPDRLMIEIRPKGTSLAALTATRSVTGSERVNLSTPRGDADKDLADIS